MKADASDRLPTEAEAESIRDRLGIRRRPRFIEETRAALRARLRDEGVSGEKTGVEEVG